MGEEGLECGQRVSLFLAVFFFFFFFYFFFHTLMHVPHHSSLGTRRTRSIIRTGFLVTRPTARWMAGAWALHAAPALTFFIQRSCTSPHEVSKPPHAHAHAPARVHARPTLTRHHPYTAHFGPRQHKCKHRTRAPSLLLIKFGVPAGSQVRFFLISK